MPDKYWVELEIEVLVALDNGELKRIDNEYLFIFISTTQGITFNS